MIALVDQLGRPVVLNNYPERIVSLVPSITELLFDLGVGNKVVGVTKFCVHPSNARRSKTVVGGTKNPDLNKIDSLQPDLILANQEENLKDHINQLQKNYQVYVSNVNDSVSAINLIKDVALMTGSISAATPIISSILKGIENCRRLITIKIPALYFIWKNPLMVAGTDTFISSNMRISGFQNQIDLERYPVLDLNNTIITQDVCLLLSSEPFPFSQKHMAGFKKLFPENRVILVDGQMFSWYGSRMIRALSYFIELQKEIRFDRNFI